MYKAADNGLAAFFLWKYAWEQCFESIISVFTNSLHIFFKNPLAKVCEMLHNKNVKYFTYRKQPSFTQEDEINDKRKSKQSSTYWSRFCR